MKHAQPLAPIEDTELVLEELDYVTKPINAVELLAKVRSLLGSEVDVAQ